MLRIPDPTRIFNPPNTTQRKPNHTQALDALLQGHDGLVPLAAALPRWPHRTWKHVVGGLELLLSFLWMTPSWRTAGAFHSLALAHAHASNNNSTLGCKPPAHSPHTHTHIHKQPPGAPW